MSTPPTKRYRRYLEPGEPCRVPKQTIHNQRLKLAATDERNSSSGHVAHGAEPGDAGPAVRSQVPSERLDDETERSQDEEDTDDVDYFDCQEDMARTTNTVCDTGSSSEEEEAEEIPLHPSDVEEGPANENAPSSSSAASAEVEDGDNPDLDDGELKSYLEKCATEMLPNETMTKAQALLLILTYIVHAGLSWSQVEGLIKLVNTLCGDEVVPDTKYLLRKLWRDRMNSLCMHFFCPACWGYLGLRTSKNKSQTFECVTCQVRHGMQGLISRGCFFLVFDLKRVLYDAMTQHAHLLYKALKQPQSVIYGVYADITNGRMYRSIRNQLHAKWSDITVTLNTDGSPVFESNKASVWPVQMLINELPFNIRFQEVLVGALWFAKHHPPPHLFMKTFVEAFNNIGTIQWTHSGEKISSRVSAMCCCVDSPARASLLNMKQFNGYFGCSWCLEEGTLLDGKHLSISTACSAAVKQYKCK